MKLAAVANRLEEIAKNVNACIGECSDTEAEPGTALKIPGRQSQDQPISGACADHRASQIKKRILIIPPGPPDEWRTAVEGLDDRLEEREAQAHEQDGSNCRKGCGHPGNVREFPEGPERVQAANEDPAVNHPLLDALDGMPEAGLTRRSLA